MSEVKNLAMAIAVAAQAGRNLQDVCHERARAGGWWTNLRTDSMFSHEEVLAMVPEKLLLIHSEVSEACEAHRKNLKDEKLPHRDGLEVELADAVIRAFDLAGALGFDLGGAIAEKLNYNAGRKDHTLAARKAAGGKRY